MEKNAPSFFTTVSDSSNEISLLSFVVCNGFALQEINCKKRILESQHKFRNRFGAMKSVGEHNSDQKQKKMRKCEKRMQHWSYDRELDFSR